MQTSKVYRSKLDAWIIVLFSVIFLITMVVPLLEGNFAGLWITIPMAIFIIHLFSTTYYTISGSELHIKSGFIVNRTINISAVRKIEETNNMISSPATSLDRLEIFYGKYESIIISPKDKAAFIADILAVNNKIIVKYK